MQKPVERVTFPSVLIIHLPHPIFKKEPHNGMLHHIPIPNKSIKFRYVMTQEKYASHIFQLLNVNSFAFTYLGNAQIKN